MYQHGGRGTSNEGQLRWLGSKGLKKPRKKIDCVSYIVSTISQVTC